MLPSSRLFDPLSLSLSQLDARIRNLQGVMGAHQLPVVYQARINTTLQEYMDERYRLLELCDESP